MLGTQDQVFSRSSTSDHVSFPYVEMCTPSRCLSKHELMCCCVQGQGQGCPSLWTNVPELLGMQRVHVASPLGVQCHRVASPQTCIPKTNDIEYNLSQKTSPERQIRRMGPYSFRF